MRSHQYAVIGLGRFGASLAEKLAELGQEVLGIDKNEAVVDEMSELLTHTIVADTTEQDVLRSAGVRNMDCAIVAIGGDIQASILTSILLKELGVKKVVTKAVSKLHGRVLQKIGVDRIIYPDRDMGIRVANQLVSPNLLDYIDISPDYSIVELVATEKIADHSLKELDTRARYGCSIVAIHKHNNIVIAPSAEDVVNTGDVMLVIGRNEQIDRFTDAIHTTVNH